jgi:hypothetical protein
VRLAARRDDQSEQGTVNNFVSQLISVVAQFREPRGCMNQGSRAPRVLVLTASPKRRFKVLIKVKNKNPDFFTSHYRKRKRTRDQNAHRHPTTTFLRESSEVRNGKAV